MIGGTQIRYTAGDCLVTCVDLPVSSHIVEASPEEPYLAVSLALDPQLIHDQRVGLADALPRAAHG